MFALKPIRTSLLGVGTWVYEANNLYLVSESNTVTQCGPSTIAVVIFTEISLRLFRTV